MRESKKHVRTVNVKIEEHEQNQAVNMSKQKAILNERFNKKTVKLYSEMSELKVANKAFKEDV